MPSITALKGRIVYNSKGNATIEIDVITDGRFLGRASAPSGASIGKHEAQSFPENNPRKALDVFNTNMKKFVGINSQDPKQIFEALKAIDDTEMYTKVGGSVAYALSVAAIDSAAKALDRPVFKLLKPKSPYRFPFPLGNILGGGAHAGPGTPDIQEILACPIGAKNIIDALEMNFDLHKEVRNVIESIDKQFTYGRGDEGAWAPNLNNDKALEVVEKAVKDCGFILGKDISLGIDFASSSFWDKRRKVYNYSRQRLIRNGEEQIDFANKLIKRYKLIYAEDPVHEEDFEGMAIINKSNPRCLVTGDDMLVTNAERLREAVNYKSCSGAILKINQSGTLYEALKFAEECKNNNINIITSHRSGETSDAHISHIAISTDSKMLKSGVVGGERVAKLNELVRLAEYDLIEGMAELSST
ncbi:MAG TPA: enolase C-terminal domain-like protein [Nitrososphaeraceae archaeon]|nr:enolase C-terminal domain-like protein [Nitrososphaeraceae archaeon]